MTRIQQHDAQERHETAASPTQGFIVPMEPGEDLTTKDWLAAGKDSLAVDRVCLSGWGLTIACGTRGNDGVLRMPSGGWGAEVKANYTEDGCPAWLRRVIEEISCGYFPPPQVRMVLYTEPKPPAVRGVVYGEADLVSVEVHTPVDGDATLTFGLSGAGELRLAERVREYPNGHLRGDHIADIAKGDALWKNEPDVT